MKRPTKVFLKFLIIFTIILTLLTACTIGAVMLTDTGFITELDTSDINLNFTSFIYYTDENGQEVEYQQLSGKENRIWADIEDISTYVQDAFVAIEDERFWTHPGFDFKRTAGAVINYVFKRNNSYGGSTITQQLIKNITGDDDVSVTRKVKEIFRAVQLERKMEKEDILELYLNTIYLGQGCNGVKTASSVYFNKDVSELNLAEAASLAGITQYPTMYDPILNPEANLEKQKVVLKKMLELGDITQEEYDEAVAFEIKFGEENAGSRSSQSYFTDTVVDEVLSDLQREKGYAPNYAAKLLYNGGLKIYATIDPDVQSTMEEVYLNDKNFSKAPGATQPQSAMVVLDPNNGELKGIVGGRGEKTGSLTLNRATQSLRQPGSTIKPIGVYAPAIEEGLVTPGTVVKDEKITIGNWSPTNFYPGFKGDVTVRYAIEQSINTVAVKVLQKLGVDKSYDFMTKNLHFTSLVDNEKRDDGVHSDKFLSSLALGGLTDGLSVIEMAAAYSAFENKGVYNSPHSYTKVLDRNGNVILEKKVEQTTAMSEKTASIMTDMMEGVVTRGTGMGARLRNGQPAAGKTGTTDDTIDLWFSGYTPYYCGVVWFGYDKPGDMSGFANSAVCVNVWKKVMDTLHQNKPVERFEKMSGVNYYQSTKLPGEDDEDKDDEDKESPSPTPSKSAEPSGSPSVSPSASPSGKPGDDVDATVTVTPPPKNNTPTPPPATPTSTPTPPPTPTSTITDIVIE